MKHSGLWVLGRLLTGLLVSVVAGGGPTATAASSLQPAVTRELHFRQHPGTPLPLGIQLRDASGQFVRLGDYFNRKPVIVVLEYLRCRSLCGYVLRDTLRALSGTSLIAGRDYELVAISIDPRDTPADARHAESEYLSTPGGAVPAGWHFLTGQLPQITQLANAVGFPFRYDAQIDQYAHPAGITIATPGGSISRYILGLGFRPLDLRLALSEAGRGSISTPVADLFLLCYCYDPGTGRYSFTINNITRLLCVATVLGLAVWIVRVSRPVPL